MKFECLIIFLLLIKYAQTIDLLTISFIKSYIENEKRPTDLICDNLGWNKNAYINLVKELSYSSVRTASFYKMSTPPVIDVKVLFLIDLETSDLDILKNISIYFKAPYRWLVLSDIRNESRNKFLWDLPLLLDSDFVLAIRNGNTFDMFELYKTSTSSSTLPRPRGSYNGTFTDVRPRREMYRRRGDVMGYEMVMSNVIQGNNASKYHLPREDREDLKYDTVAQMAWSVGKLAFEMINATPKYVFNAKPGHLVNGTWSGMINDLITGKAVLGTNMNLDGNCLDATAATDTISPFQIKFIFRQLPLSDVSNIFTLPFSFNVWVASIACAVISTLALIFNGQWGKTLKEDQPTGGITDAILIMIGAISTQGSSIEPKSYSGRMMLWTVFLSMMLIFTAYSANLLALLQAPSNSIKTFDQLSKSKLTLGAEDLAYQKIVFLRDKALYHRIAPEHGKKHLFTSEECANKIRKESYAIHCVLNPMYRRIEKVFLDKEKCDLTDIKYLNLLPPIAPATKGTPYIELLKVGFKRIREAGIYSVLKQRYNVPKPKCDGQAPRFSSIDLQNIRPVLLFYLIGLAISVLILVVEVIVYRV